jgi:hypothetical protein
VKQLWDTMETGGENNDASYKDVIEDPRWNIEPHQQQRDICLEKSDKVFISCCFVSAEFSLPGLR